jgi:hypothetical protein
MVTHHQLTTSPCKPNQTSRSLPRLDPKALRYLAPHLLLVACPIPNILLVALHNLHILADRALHPRAGARAPRESNTTASRTWLAGYVFRIPECHRAITFPRYSRRAELPSRCAQSTGLLLEPRAAAGVDAAGYGGHVRYPDEAVGVR